MPEFETKQRGRHHSIREISMLSVTEQDRMFSIALQEGKDMQDSLNIRIGEKYPITVKVEPSGTEYADFTINPETYVRVYNSSGGRVDTVGDLVIDNTLKTVTYIWDTGNKRNPALMKSPQQYTIVMWISITYVNSEGEVLDTLIASDNITKNLIRASRLE